MHLVGFISLLSTMHGTTNIKLWFTFPFLRDIKAGSLLHKQLVNLLDTTDQVSYKSKKKREFVGRGRRRRRINTLTHYCNHLQEGRYTTCKSTVLSLPRVVTHLPKRHSYSRFKDRISKSGSSLPMPEFAGDSCPNKRDSKV